ncbi:hypothetical protein EV132_13131 [Rhizobium sullae]|uniref:Uncharacterized protein n=1 Tax=Rhizobium sullae TaxID=50338 RepID=A0A4R3PZV0_RHISU|nr:hypothetical protein EV132_13131 [Rhizobium sullae]
MKCGGRQLNCTFFGSKSESGWFAFSHGLCDVALLACLAVTANNKHQMLASAKERLPHVKPLQSGWLEGLSATSVILQRSECSIQPASIH